MVLLLYEKLHIYYTARIVNITPSRLLLLNKSMVDGSMCSMNEMINSNNDFHEKLTV